MVTALYRRYRPENFAELIGQSQVTDPLRTALRTNRVNHAYLFSGPRGCGKTTSARILARCLNCAEGPTDTPCGVCPSCVELARDGSGSLDVIEIDAASHNGVDDARDLRDRAVFAPARDRYKIFILDEAHMVTPQGFNALLKLVEEPPEHVKFIFATTEPEKVIGTIRSRTHHYPFRLVPPAVMLEYIEQLCTQESVSVAPGVLPLVVRAGGGSVRDTLSLLDQLMAGSEDGAIAYERAVALLGYTDAALLDDVVDALAVADPASAFAAIDRVVQTGQDPRRFVEDLLERLRDLIVVAATNESAAAVLRGVSPEELDTMSRQAGVFGATGLSRSADIANRALTDMTGATSPRLHLELMTARMLVPEADDTQRGALARVERLERRVGVGDVGGHDAGGHQVGAGEQSAPAVAAAPRREQPAAAAPAAPAPSLAPTPVPAPGAARTTAPERPAAQQSAPQADSGAVARDAAASWAAVAPSAPEAPAQTPTSTGASKPQDAKSGAEPVSPSSTGQGTTIGDEPAVRTVGAVGFQQMRDSWPQIVEHVQHAKRSAWSVVVTAQVTALRDDVLTLTFPSQQDVASFKEMSDPSASVSELLRAAIVDVLGLRVKFVARGPGQQQRQQQQSAPAQQPAPAQQAAPAQQPAPAQQAAPAQRPAPVAQAPATAAPESPAPKSADAPAPATTAAPAPESQAVPAAAAEPEAAPAAAAVPEAVSEQQAAKAAPAPEAAPAPAAPTSPAPQRDAAPADPTPAPSGAPVTDWAVATIPANDPTADAVPESVEPSWAAPFGTAPASAPVAPAETTTTEPTQPAALARPAGATGGQPDQPTTPGQQAASGAAAVPPGGPVVPGVPVDDYPLDDEPYDDGAPFPDPGIGRGAATASAAPAAPAQQAAPQRASQPSAPAAAAPRTAPPARRAPVAGRYGEAVVREILNAQFIEETALHQDGA
ncbi:DNA polymerase III subunit gamma and tau [Curtobacterium sp. VKM Ac-2889]|uniref:DNA polymerase III subunit gamma and tau n=1 Tax=unclassified Curtobacterium TaxID=257496 RepID=UPI00188C4240|nr:MULTISPECIES: DNA polymerase III subunit gamma and tau [unclassified Curtobacterium]MBF4597133.1 DNA polymerase III subunit gamma and tau [Curtobacterium sp. VKM Ac-1796]MBF4609823.1 DNA polymerase III subunit gamma and tau [Curtobacterium sp. VKM Ac-2889]